MWAVCAGLSGQVCPAFQLALSHAVSAHVCPEGLVGLSLELQVAVANCWQRWWWWWWWWSS